MEVGGLSAAGMARDYGINYWRPCLAATISVLNVFVWSIETSLCESRWTAQALSVIILFRFSEDKRWTIIGNHWQLFAITPSASLELWGFFHTSPIKVHSCQTPERVFSVPANAKVLKSLTLYVWTTLKWARNLTWLTRVALAGSALKILKL